MTANGSNQNSDADTIEISDTEKFSGRQFLSIYMATYNHQRHISQAIESVISQHINFPIKLIIGEDYSKDRTPYIVREYQRRYPELIRIITSA